MKNGYLYECMFVIWLKQGRRQDRTDHRLKTTDQEDSETQHSLAPARPGQSAG